ncbi:hypothetical protein AYJ56_20630 [Brucella anthropi]|nr:hypothetical protein AYJ56_20630 [Brucella anthropi]
MSWRANCAKVSGMFDWPLIFASLLAIGVAVFLIYCLAVMIFAKPDGKPVEPTAIDTVDMLPFMNHDAD